MYELLPAYRCIETRDGRRAPHEVALPGLDADWAGRARADLFDRLLVGPPPPGDPYGSILVA